MRNLKTIENRVLAVLKEHPEARNDDMKLYLLVSKACIYDTHGISHFSFEDVMSNYKAYGIPCFESIRRTSDLESMLSQVIAKARSRDEKLKAAKEKAAKIKHQNEKLNAVLDLEKPSALTEEECELLIQYLLAENNVVLEEYRICYMRGLMDGMEKAR